MARERGTFPRIIYLGETVISSLSATRSPAIKAFQDSIGQTKFENMIVSASGTSIIISLSAGFFVLATVRRYLRPAVPIQPVV